jgi:hypothetical protein
MLRPHRSARPASGSAAVARTRLRQTLRADRSGPSAAPQLQARVVGAPSAVEPPDHVLGRLLDEPVAVRREA